MTKLIAWQPQQSQYQKGYGERRAFDGLYKVRGQ